MTPNLLDELEAYNRLCSTPGIDVSFKYQAAANFMNTHAPALADMAKRMEAAERDAARYRWLRDHNNVIGEDGITECPVEIFIHGESHAPGHLDAQVDAAIDATQEGAGRNCNAKYPWWASATSCMFRAIVWRSMTLP